jgi:uncharacterized protein YceK
MKNIVIVLAIAILAGCGANAQAIKSAELKCLSADYASLQQKLQQGAASSGSAAEGGLLQLTEGEIICALRGLSATAPSGSGS